MLPAEASLLGAWLVRDPFEDELRIAADAIATERLNRIVRRPRNPDERHVEGMGLVIGDITCQMNARSHSPKRSRPATFSPTRRLL
ncbi:MAG: hypothetical protein AAFY72_16360 [Cyanobacteria bacterium J06649_4]